MIVATALALIKKDWITAVRYRKGLFLNTFAPTAQLLTFYYLARAVGPQFRPEGMAYFTFLLLGTGFYTFLLRTMHGFLHAIQESQQAGTLEVLMTTATPPARLLILSALSSSAGGALQLFLYVAAGYLMFPAPLHVDVWGLGVVFVLSLLVAAAFGTVAAAIQLSTYKGSAVLWVFGACASLAAGTLFPVDALPKPLYWFSEFLPLTHAVTGMRQAISGGASLQREIFVLLLCAATMLPASHAFFTWSLRRARIQGTLSLC